MARSYAKLLTSIWSDEEFRDLTDSAQRLFLLLLSQPALSAAGVLPMQRRKWARLSSSTTEEVITEALDELETHAFILVDEMTEEVMIRTFIKHDGGTRNPNMRKAIVQAAEIIESPELRRAALAQLDHPEDRTEDPTEDHSEGDTESTHTLTPTPDTATHPPSLSDFEAWWAKYPRKVAKGKARTSYQAALKKRGVTSATLAAALEAHLPAWAACEPRFIPHPSTWLNQERWADDPPPVAVAKTATQGAPGSRAANHATTQSTLQRLKNGEL